MNGYDNTTQQSSVFNKVMTYSYLMYVYIYIYIFIRTYIYIDIVLIQFNLPKFPIYPLRTGPIGSGPVYSLQARFGRSLEQKNADGRAGNKQICGPQSLAEKVR